MLLSGEATNEIYLFSESGIIIDGGEKNQYYSRVRSTSVNADIFTTRDEIYLVSAENK